MDKMLLTVAAGATLAMLSGCDGGTGPSNGRLTVSAVATEGVAAQAADSFTLGGHTLVFDKVELVLKEIELERRFHDDCDDDGQGGPGSSSRDDDTADDCEELEFGPLLIDLPLTGTAERVITVEADSGTFDEVEFKVHKPEDDDGDTAFLAAHPDFRRVSIRVQAWFDGEPVAFETDLDAEQEHELSPPLILTERSVTNLTLTVDLSTWFIVDGELVNPALGLKGQPFESQVKENVKRSIEMFEDHDVDGHDDDD